MTYVEFQNNFKLAQRTHMEAIEATRNVSNGPHNHRCHHQVPNT